MNVKGNNGDRVDRIQLRSTRLVFPSRSLRLASDFSIPRFRHGRNFEKNNFFKKRLAFFGELNYNTISDFFVSANSPIGGKSRDFRPRYFKARTALVSFAPIHESNAGAVAMVDRNRLLSDFLQAYGGVAHIYSSA